MDQKYKTLIPLIVIFFIFGVVVGYVAHKPQTIEKIVTTEKIVTVTVTVTPPPLTPTPTPTPTPTSTQTPSATVALKVSDFIVKNYDPFKDTPAKTIELSKNGANPNNLYIRPGDSVLIKITEYSSQLPLTLILNATEERNLGTGGAVVVTFNKKGSYSLKAIIRSGDKNILPTSYADGTISVY